MKDLSKSKVPEFFDQTSKTYDAVVRYSTFGRDNSWKKTIVSKIPYSNTILELACGTGLLTKKIYLANPRSKITAVDITRGYLDLAIDSLQNSGIEFLCQDAQQIHLGKKFDCIVTSYLPKYCEPEILVKRCTEHIEDNGVVLLHDFAYPSNAAVKFLWKCLFKLLQFCAIFLPEWKVAFYELPKIVKHTTWIEDYKKLFMKKGFDVTISFQTMGCSCILEAKMLENPVDKKS